MYNNLNYSKELTVFLVQYEIIFIKERIVDKLLFCICKYYLMLQIKKWENANSLVFQKELHPRCYL